MWDAKVIQELIDECKVVRASQKLTGGPDTAIQSTRSLLAKVPKDLIGTRVTVNGNGSCWLYAFMAGYGGMLDHAKPCVITNKNQTEKAPSAVDVTISKTLILAMQTHVQADKMSMKDAVELAQIKKEIGALKVATRTEGGTYGADSVIYGVLANLMQVKIVCLDLSLPQSFRIATGDEKGNFEEHCQMDTLEARLRTFDEEQQPFVVVEFNGIRGRGGHFAGYLPPERRMFRVHSFLQKHFQGCSNLRCLR